jgi:4-hydroxy-3-methylbut-2-en-1-yl diphosphate synthase IspG/GcpE
VFVTGLQLKKGKHEICLHTIGDELTRAELVDTTIRLVLRKEKHNEIEICLESIESVLAAEEEAPTASSSAPTCSRGHDSVAWGLQGGPQAQQHRHECHDQAARRRLLL